LLIWIITRHVVRLLTSIQAICDGYSRTQVACMLSEGTDNIDKESHRDNISIPHT
jgi:hypothetical protein